jgi:hypothetical protein
MNERMRTDFSDVAAGTALYLGKEVDMKTSCQVVPDAVRQMSYAEGTTVEVVRCRG